MNVDLMCHICDGSGVRAYEPAQRCVLCRGSGRRYPTLREWDALVAERDYWRDLYHGFDNVRAVRIRCGDCGDVIEVPANGDYARCSCPGTWHMSTGEIIEAEDGEA